MNNLILVLDFKSKFSAGFDDFFLRYNVSYTKLDGDCTAEEVKKISPKGIILTGSPFSVYKEDSIKLKKEILELGIPVLGICHGMQSIAYVLGKKVDAAEVSEEDLTMVELEDSALFKGLDKNTIMLMRHSDRVYELPDGFIKTATTKDCPIAGMENTNKKIFATQFHPEKCEMGDIVLKNFVFDICGYTK